jgi:peptidoglycan/LPS O-acetylase OafA/YrhL
MGAVVAIDQAAEREWISLGPLAMRMLRSLATPIALGSLGALALKTRLFAPVALVLGRRASPLVLLALVVAGAVVPWSLFTVQVLMALLVVASCLREDHLLSAVLAWRPLRHVGLVSYGVYLLNVPAIQLAKRVVPQRFVFVLGLALSIAFATAAHIALEKPVLRLRARFRPRR